MTIKDYLARLTAMIQEHMAIMREAQKVVATLKRKHRNIWDANDMIPRGNSEIQMLRQAFLGYEHRSSSDECTSDMMQVLAHYEERLKERYKQLEYVKCLIL